MKGAGHTFVQLAHTKTAHCSLHLTQLQIKGTESKSPQVHKISTFLCNESTDLDVEYVYRFVSLGGLRTKSMTSQRGTLQDGR